MLVTIAFIIPQRRKLHAENIAYSFKTSKIRELRFKLRRRARREKKLNRKE